MGTTERFGEKYRRWATGEKPSGICEICGTDLDVDPESGESHCPVCENPDL